LEMSRMPRLDVAALAIKFLRSALSIIFLPLSNTVLQGWYSE
jgi:hypothetical protein